MLRAIVEHSIRSFKRQKGYFIINVVGLAIGLACSLLITTFVISELSFDRFNEKGDRIYKLILDGKIGEREFQISYTAPVIAPTMKRDFPEIELFCRINNTGNINLKYLDQSFKENAFIEADSTFFQMFSIKLLRGDDKNVLNEPYKLVISESVARKIFGEEDPINKPITIGTDDTPYVVSGIMEDIPETCHFEANIISSFMTNPNSGSAIWTNNSYDTYLLLYPNTDPHTIEEKFPAMVRDNVGPELEQGMGISLDDFVSSGNRYSFFLQPLFKIHLDPSIEQPMKPATDPKYLAIFGIVAILIVLIAAINFMNLSTAQASKRSKEVGMKKVSGSSRTLLINQFMIESVLLALIALIFAIIMVKVSIPYFNDLLNAQFGLYLTAKWYNIPVLIVTTILIGILAGSYPALYLSSISPVAVFRRLSTRASGNRKLRSLLVVFQFTASIMLIIGTLIMYRQITYMLNKDPGYNKNNLLVISNAEELGTHVEIFKERLREIPGVVNVAAATAIPNHNNNNNGYILEGKTEEALLISTSWVDYDYLDTYQMELVEGRFFDQDFPSELDGCVINESAVREYNIEDPLSARFIEGSGARYVPVIGVVKDFNHESLQRPVSPYMMRFRTEDHQFGYMTVRIARDNLVESVREIEKTWKESTRNGTISYFFMDDDMSRIYKQERQSAKLTVIFALFAILVASMGLFGLTSFMLQQRTREIGVRKAMGASASSVFSLVTRDVLLLVTIAALIGSPIIYIIASRWLENYFFRITIKGWEFILAYLVAITIAIATISLRTLKAARINPAQSLQYE